MSIWNVIFEEHYSNMDEDEWDDEITSNYTVIANDYESALEAAKAHALSRSYHDDENNIDAHCDGVRLIEIKKGAAVDAIAAPDLQPPRSGLTENRK